MATLVTIGCVVIYLEGSLNLIPQFLLISLLCKEGDFGHAGECIQMRYDAADGKFFVVRAACSSSAKLLCAKEGNPGTGFNTVVIDLLLDFKTCQNLL